MKKRDISVRGNQSKEMKSSPKVKQLQLKELENKSNAPKKPNSISKANKPVVKNRTDKPNDKSISKTTLEKPNLEKPVSIKNQSFAKVGKTLKSDKSIPNKANIPQSRTKSVSVKVNENNSGEIKKRSINEKQVKEAKEVATNLSSDDAKEELNLIKVQPELDEKTLETIKKESSQITETSANNALHEKTARPTTARAAPPKIIKRSKQVIERTDNLESPIIPVNDVISEADADKIEDDFFIIKENHEEEILTTDRGGNYENEKGSLVKQLVETKKQLEGVELDNNIGYNIGSSQIIALKTSIQTFTRHAAPLATLLDYLQQHINSMISEFYESVQQHKMNIEKLEKQKSLIDTELTPLKEQLRVLENEISNANDRIDILKANIIKNEENSRKIIIMAIEKFNDSKK